MDVSNKGVWDTYYHVRQNCFQVRQVKIDGDIQIVADDTGAKQLTFTCI